MSIFSAVQVLIASGRFHRNLAWPRYRFPDTSYAVHNPNLRLQGAKCLFVLVVEEVVGSVLHELSLTHSADGSGSRSSIGV